MENYRIEYDSCFDAFLLNGYIENDFCCNIDACCVDEVDRLRSWLLEYDVSYIDDFAWERLRMSV